MSDSILHTLQSSVLWAAMATLLVAIPGTLLAYLLARKSFMGKQVVSTLINLPLVLPPTAIGFLLLQLFAAEGWLGPESLGFDLNIILTWKGVVLASAVIASPLIIRTARVSFEGIDPRLESLAYTLGYSRLHTLLRFTLPMAWRGIVAALILGFGRALGEFGATVVIAGNIPGRTQTLASAIFSAQQAGLETEANMLLLTSLVAGFILIFATEYLARPITSKSIF